LLPDVPKLFGMMRKDAYNDAAFLGYVFHVLIVHNSLKVVKYYIRPVLL